MSAPAPLEAAAALELILREVNALDATPVLLSECDGRVTARPVLALGPLPPFDSSAMDGFALRSAELATAGPTLAVVDESRAGHPARSAVGSGQAVRISTGAMLPAGADAVVPIEEVEEAGGQVTVGGAVETGRFVRRAGEDVRAGTEVVPAGVVIGAAEAGVIASTGAAVVECVRRPRLALLTSGDELREPGEAAGPGQIYDSNSFALASLTRAAGGEVSFVGRVRDDLEATRAALAELMDADVVVVSGGVSVGPHDHTKAALAELGVEELFWRVALRPGGPTWAGVLRREGRSTLVFGLPGNPVSAIVTFHLFVRPTLLAMQGRDPSFRRVLAALADSFEKPAGKAQYLRCSLRPAEAGWSATLTRASQGSHLLTSMLGADGLAVIPVETTLVAAGDPVEVLIL